LLPNLLRHDTTKVVRNVSNGKFFLHPMHRFKLRIHLKSVVCADSGKLSISAHVFR